jgi:hypothetical protein
MSVGETSGPIHPDPTRSERRRQYQFYNKHHRGRPSDAAQWEPGVSREEEFTVFDDADWHEIADERGWLYGVRRRDAMGEIPDLGMRGEQVAEFPFARPTETWHGYPLWPLSEEGPANRRGEQARPSKGVFLRMESVGMLTLRERKRLYKGNHL